MKIFQPIASGSVFFPNLTSVSQSNVITVDISTGQLYYTASSAIGGGGSGVGFPYTGSATITGSLVVTGSTTSTLGFTGSLQGTASFANNAATSSYATNFTVANNLTIDGTLIVPSSVTSTIVGTNNLYQQVTGSYTSAHGSYTVHKNSSSRAGEFITSWYDGITSYTDYSTVDIGNTSDITFQSLIVTGQIQINAVAASSGWTVKMLVTYI